MTRLDSWESTIDLTDPQPATTGRPTFTITDAATACAVSRKTITRKLADLAGHGAAKDDEGIWRIPVEALLAVGLHPGRSLPSPAPRSAGAAGGAPARPESPAAPPTPPAEVVSVPRAQWDDLRIRLARAEAEAAERAMALVDARLALRALTAGPSTPVAAQTGTTAAPVVTGPWVSGPTGGSYGPGHGTGTPAAAVPMTTPAPAPVAPDSAPDVPAATAVVRKRRWWHSSTS